MVDHIVTAAAHYGPPHRPQASRPHHDQLGLVLSGDVTDDLAWVAVEHCLDRPRHLRRLKQYNVQPL